MTKLCLLQHNNNNKTTRRASANSAKADRCQPKVIQEWNPDFRINPDPDVCRIVPKTLWIHYLVGISHFAKFRKNRPVIV